jgi:hypothetical protein
MLHLFPKVVVKGGVKFDSATKRVYLLKLLPDFMLDDGLDFL